MKNEILHCGKILIEKKLTLAFAESATAGYLTAQFSLVPHAGEFLKGGLACYDAELKKSLLNVPQGLIDAFTPESMEVTIAMCRGLTQLIPADIHIAVTGLTCPGGSETNDKPVGTIFISALLRGEKLFYGHFCFQGSEEEIISQTASQTAHLLLNEFQKIKDE